jgi:serine-type D-Ala-D-Ala carboxypeptidase (penicillin-binding protein 5/6)
MNKLFLKIILVFCFSTNFVFSKPEIGARTAILLDYHSNKILYELEMNHSISPASMTKIMTAIVAFDLLKKEKLSLDDKITVSEKAWRMSQSGYSSMFIMINDEISVENLLKGIIIASGNDACVALAEGIAGSEENFVDIMNEKAEEIGMLETKFANSSGINDPDNYSTVFDIALMSKYLIKNYPGYYEYFKEKEFTWDRTGGNPISQNNRNSLLFSKLGVDGIKTGHLAVEKYSLASSIKKENRRLIAVGSGFESPVARKNQSLKLLNWGLRNTDTYEVSKSSKTFFELKTWLGKKNTVKTITKKDIYITIDKKDSRKFRVEMEYKGPIKAPISIGQELGIIKVYNKKDLIESAPIYSAEKVKRINFLKSVFTSLNYMIWGDV